MSLYDSIGKNYDETRKADKRIIDIIYRLFSPHSNGKYLDLACGTGNYTIALTEKGLDFVGVDASQIMLENAYLKNKNIEWIKSCAEDIPLRNNYFDGALCTLAIHHFSNLENAFKEVFRVLDSGKFIIFTCSHQQIKNYWLNNYFKECINTMYEYMPDLPFVIEILEKVGFKIKEIVPYFIDDNLEDCFLNCKKNQPEVYLNREFLSGMSVFSAKSKNEDINKGILKLKKDIETGKVKEIIKKCDELLLGDYLFIVAEKCK